MKKIFLDIGSHNGQTLLLAIKKFPDCQYYIGVEPVESLAFKSRKLIPESYRQRVIIFNLALDSQKNDFQYIDFYEDVGSNKLGSSILADKNTVRKNKIQVLSLDVLYFLNLLFQNKEEIILKIDIEGKEYDILEKILTTTFLQTHVKNLFIEWHWNKTKSIPQTRHDQVVSALNKIGIKVTGDSKKDQFYAGL